MIEQQQQIYINQLWLIYIDILANDRTTQLQEKIGVYHRWSNDSLSWSLREPYLLSRPSDEYCIKYYLFHVPMLQLLY